MTSTARDHLVAVGAGAVAANVVPHLAHGIANSPFPTPFADPPGVGDSSPGLNVLWATMNAAGAAALLYAARTKLSTPRYWMVFGVGAAGASMGLRTYFRGVRG